MFNRKFVLNLVIKIAIIVLIAAVSSTAIYFLSKQIAQKNLSMREKKDLDYLIRNQEELNQKIQNDFVEVDPAYREKITSSLPSVYNILSFVDAMESLSKKYSLQETLNFNQPEPAGIPGQLSLARINFNLSLSGANVDTFTNYLKDFESLPYFTSIKTISLVAAGKQGWSDTSVINISGSFYAQQ